MNKKYVKFDLANDVGYDLFINNHLVCRLYNVEKSKGAISHYCFRHGIKSRFCISYDICGEHEIAYPLYEANDLKQAKTALESRIRTLIQLKYLEIKPYLDLRYL